MRELVNVVVNGTERTFEAGSAVPDVLAGLGVDPEHRGLAVAVGDAVVPASLWSSTVLADGDRVEVVGAVAGG